MTLLTLAGEVLAELLAFRGFSVCLSLFATCADTCSDGGVLGSMTTDATGCNATRTRVISWPPTSLAGTMSFVVRSHRQGL